MRARETLHEQSVEDGEAQWNRGEMRGRSRIDQWLRRFGAGPAHFLPEVSATVGWFNEGGVLIVFRSCVKHRAA